jgi:pyridoxamine 5'-phosphate oxidase
MSSQLPVADIRKDYKLKELSEASITTDPIAQFDLWWNEALSSRIDEVNAMTLATVSEDGYPDARIVLLKGYDANGFVFFTNYDSAKGKELEVHPRATLVFFWKELERQVRISGWVERTSAKESDDYFHSRPPGSQIGAIASPQSQVIGDRKVLNDQVDKLSAQYAGAKSIPRPDHWGGYRVIPRSIEFWQGRPSRLHDRIVYRRQKDNASAWVIERLAP